MSEIANEYDFENAPCGFLSFYPDGQIVQINQTLLTWLRSSAEEVVLKKKLRDVLSRGGYLYYQMYVLPLLNMQGYINEISFELVSPDQIATSCLFNASAKKNEDGTIRVINAILFNITDRKKYELEILRAKTSADNEKRRFEFLANTLPNILWTTLPSGQISFRNDRFISYFPQFINQSNLSFLRSVLPPEELRPTLEILIKAVKEVNEVQMELRLKNGQGQYTWFFVRIIPCKDPAGELSLWLGSCTDIHLQKEKQMKSVSNLNMQLSKASLNIEQNAQLLKEVAFAQSHLVRSPLAKILALIALLNDCEVDTETRFLLSLLTQSSEQLDTIVSDIVSRSHAEP